MPNQISPPPDSPKWAGKVFGCSAACASLLLLMIILPVILYYSLVAVGSVLIVADPIVPVDAVVILSGDRGDRLSMAADLLNRGFVHSLVITNTHPAANWQLVREAIALGFNPENIFITEKEVDSTADEARAVRKFAQSRGWTSLMVVTDPFHSFRTRIIFRRELRGSGVSVAVRPVVGHWFRSNTWFYYQEGWRFVFLEIGKLFNYLLF